ncbi:unnamed protein product [Pleuronectes platessa]|uniref:Uncharacterized protein n=1 Tax=Pleuronectes platessa TaxID=8262 RepID=A0A9N7UQN3_PLEPL|nr:unnamed protein product [Pleuronectes platessa]
MERGSSSSSSQTEEEDKLSRLLRSPSLGPLPPPGPQEASVESFHAVEISHQIAPLGSYYRSRSSLGVKKAIREISRRSAGVDGVNGFRSRPSRKAASSICDPSSALRLLSSFRSPRCDP